MLAKIANRLHNLIANFLFEIGAPLSTTKGIRAPDTTEAQADLETKRQRASQLIACFVDAINELKRLDTEREAEIKKINDRYQPRFDQLISTRDDLARQLWEVAPELIERLGHGKRSIFLTTGTLTLKKVADSLVITDEKRAQARIKDLGWVKKVIKIERKIQKTPLRKLLQADNGPKSMDGVKIVTGEDRLYVNDEIQIDRVATAANAANGDPGADSE